MPFLFSLPSDTNRVDGSHFESFVELCQHPRQRPVGLELCWANVVNVGLNFVGPNNFVGVDFVNFVGPTS
jgi:hypothetical protein